jgi:hypothetical protein
MGIDAAVSQRSSRGSAIESGRGTPLSGEGRAVAASPIAPGCRTHGNLGEFNGSAGMLAISTGQGAVSTAGSMPAITL